MNNKIKNLDRSKFKEDLVLGGLYLTKKEIDFKLDKISQNLDKIENNYILTNPLDIDMSKCYSCLQVNKNITLQGLV